MDLGSLNIKSNVTNGPAVALPRMGMHQVIWTCRELNTELLGFWRLLKKASRKSRRVQTRYFAVRLQAPGFEFYSSTLTEFLIPVLIMLSQSSF